MDIRYKLYPYPVLSDFTDDYVNSMFEVSVTAEQDGYYMLINFSAELTNKKLTELLHQGNIQFVYHLECAQTGYRTALMTTESQHSCRISTKDIRGKLQICSFIIASEDLAEYVNENFHEDYRGFKFSVDAGCVLAVAKQFDVNVDIDTNDLANTPSVFSIIRNADESALGMIVDMDMKKIVIKIPETEFYNYKSIKDEIVIQPILNSLVIVPALTYVLEEVDKRNTDEKYELSTYAWYRAIKKALLEKFNCDIESEKFSETNMLEVAQKLINIPLSKALYTLSNGYGYTYSEDDE